jgi:hypothetical protein
MEELYEVVFDNSTGYLYVVSNSKINIGDWFIVRVFSFKGESLGYFVENCVSIKENAINFKSIETLRSVPNCKKIIASNNYSINTPRLDDRFINIFNERLKSDNPIKNIEIDHEFDENDAYKKIMEGNGDFLKLSYKPKIDKSNNLVIKGI